VARRHRLGCDGSSCLQEEEEGGRAGSGPCSVTRQHLLLSNSIQPFFKTLPGYDAYLQQAEGEKEGEEEEEEEEEAKDKSQASNDVGGADGVSTSSTTTAITVNLISASDLINSDVVGVSDPYVILTLPNQSVTSKTINNDLDPVFNQSFSLLWNGSDPLLVEVWDFDSFKPDGKWSALPVSTFEYVYELT
jgi:hypothetical protein